MFADIIFTQSVYLKTRSMNQIKDIPDSYLAIDDMEVGSGNKIPLWMFGFLY